MPASIAASNELLDAKDSSAPATVDKREREPSLAKADGSSNACCCAICSQAASRKSDSSTEAACDRERQSGATAPSVLSMSIFKSEESYLDVPTASALSLATPTIYPDESALDITIISPPTSAHSHEASQTQSITDSITLHTVQREPAPISFNIGGRERSPSPRIFVQSASTQSNLSLATSIDAAFLAPRPAPIPPALPGATQNMSLTFVPFFRRVEERDMIACQICLDEEPADESVVIQSCGHSFGRECMRSYILSRLDERRFPIPCPCCSAADEAGSNPGLVTSGIATQVNLSDADCARWDELEFLMHAVRFECGKCNKSHSIDRRKLVKEKSKKRVYCPTAGCQQIWCRNCQATIEPGEEKKKHVCEGKKELKLLLKKEGWRQCPGCNIPVQKSSGCNHIACSAPGCNTHFCYRCGQILIRSVFGSEIHHAISNHFRRRLYFWRCSQFHDPNVVLRLITRGWRR